MSTFQHKDPAQRSASVEPRLICVVQDVFFSWDCSI